MSAGAKINADATYYAKWTKLHTLTFNTNGGNEIEPITGTNYVSLPGASREGYVFVGWHDNNELSGTVLHGNYQLTKDASVFAEWTTLNVLSSDGYVLKDNVYSSQQKLDAGTASTDISSVFTTDKYTTRKFYTKPTSSTQYTEVDGAHLPLHNGTNVFYLRIFASTPYKTAYSSYYEINVSVKAEYTVTFYLLEEVLQTQKVVEGNTIAAPTTPTLQGYRFDGWYKDICGETAWNFVSDTTTENTSLFAVWSPDDGTVSSGLSFEQRTIGNSFAVTGLGSFTGSALVVPSVYKGGVVAELSQTATANGGSLLQIELPSSLCFMSTGCLGGATNLTELALNGKSYVFPTNSPLSTYFGGTVPQSLTSVVMRSGEVLPDYAFSGCAHLTDAVLPDGLLSVGSGAFKNCSALANIILPGTVTTIGDSAFSGCAFSSIILPSAVTTLPSSCFENCVNLTAYTFPTTITKLKSRVFANSGIKSLLIPSSVVSIAEDSFGGIDENAILYFQAAQTTYEGSNAYYCGINGVLTSGNFEYVALGGAITLTRRISGDGEIPSAIGGTPVTTLGARLFGGLNQSTVTIPSSITTIKSDCFRGSTMTSIVLPKTLTTIEDGAFYNCNSLAQITLPFVGKSKAVENFYEAYFGYIFKMKVVSNANSAATPIEGATAQATRKRISGNLYDHYYYHIPTSLTRVVISADADTPIPAESFNSCANLNYVKIVGADYIGSGAFTGCANLSEVEIDSTTLSSAVQYSSSKVFLDCPVTKFTVRYTDTFAAPFRYLSTGAVYDATETSPAANQTLTEIVVLGTGVPAGAFAHCRGLTSIALSEIITSIGDGAFHGCTSMKNITLPVQLTSLGQNAFSGCKALSCVTYSAQTGYALSVVSVAAFDQCFALHNFYVPSTVTQIGNNAFRGCAGSTIMFGAASYSPPSGCEDWNPSNAAVQYGISLFNSDGFEFAISTDHASVIGYYGEGGTVSVPSVANDTAVKRIEKRAFAENLAVVDLVLPSSITEIQNYAFYKASNLTSVTFGTGLATIGSYAFAQSGLTSLTLPASIESVGESAFSDCTSLQSVDLESATKLYVIESRTFSMCRTLSSVTFNTTLQKIGSYAFESSAMQNVNLESTRLIEIGMRAFRNGSTIQSVVFPSTLLTICVRAFEDCSALSSINCPQYLLSLETGAFSGCTNLLETVNCVSYAGKYAVACSDSATSITLRDGTEGIASFAFYGKSNLTSVQLSSDLRFIGGNAFASSGVSYTVSNNVNYLSDGQGSFWAISLAGTVSGALTLHAKTAGIADYAFQNSTFYSVTIPKSVKTIGNYAFHGNSNLYDVAYEADSSLTSIGNSSFSGCIGLNYMSASTPYYVFLPKNLKVIGSLAFKNNGRAAGSIVVYVASSIAVIGSSPFITTNENDINLQFAGTEQGVEAVCTYDSLYDGETPIDVQYGVAHTY